MGAINILLIGAGTGVIFAIISILMINTFNSEKYPIGGFLPALWMVTDLGEYSKIEVAGLLIMGGITGFYIMLAFRKMKFDIFGKKLQKQIEENKVSRENNDGSRNTITVKGKSLAEFLK